MRYYEFTVRVPDISREALLHKLVEIGSTGCVERDGEIIAYFTDEADPALVSAELTRFEEVLSAAGLDPDLSFGYDLLPEKDWNESWKEGFTPIDVGDTLTIIPSWLRKETGRLDIVVDPGMVFGTGHHETTRRCLILIERLSKDIARGRFLDIGTGSGILAIAAAKLGFREVLAVDTDPLAVDAATRNAALNALSTVDVREGDIYEAGGTFDLITANLLSGILIGLAPELALRLNPEGIAVLSGMLEGQEDEVAQAMEKAGLALREKEVDGKWVSLVVSRRRNTDREGRK